LGVESVHKVAVVQLTDKNEEEDDAQLGLIQRSEALAHPFKQPGGVLIESYE
jgi:hypothetical protein